MHNNEELYLCAAIRCLLHFTILHLYYMHLYLSINNYLITVNIIFFLMYALSVCICCVHLLLSFCTNMLLCSVLCG